MFRTAELGQTVTGKEFKKRSLELRQRLLETQVLLDRAGDFSVMIDFAGVAAQFLRARDLFHMDLGPFDQLVGWHRAGNARGDTVADLRQKSRRSLLWTLGGGCSSHGLYDP